MLEHFDARELRHRTMRAGPGVRRSVVVALFSMLVGSPSHAAEKITEPDTTKWSEEYKAFYAKGRTLEEIQQGFDRNKDQLRKLWTEYPTASGRVLLAMVIEPDGSVSNCRVVSSTVYDAELEEKTVAMVSTFKFGARPVPAFNLNWYPVYFIPDKK